MECQSSSQHIVWSFELTTGQNASAAIACKLASYTRLLRGDLTGGQHTQDASTGMGTQRKWLANSCSADNAKQLQAAKPQARVMFTQQPLTIIEDMPQVRSTASTQQTHDMQPSASAEHMITRIV